MLLAAVPLPAAAAAAVWQQGSFEKVLFGQEPVCIQIRANRNQSWTFLRDPLEIWETLEGQEGSTPATISKAMTSDMRV